MKITGKIDQQDQIAWINWLTDNPAREKNRWSGWILLILALGLPPFVFHLIGDQFHWETYVGSIMCWALLLTLWRFGQLIYARRQARRKKEEIPFELQWSDETVHLSVRDRKYEYPADKVGSIPLRRNLVLTMDGFPVCVTPRNENIDGEHTVREIDQMIKRFAEPTTPANGEDAMEE